MPISRRSFLGSAGALVGLSGLRTVRAATLQSSMDPWVEIHPGNLLHNVTQVSRRVGGRPILAVIKNNGYGLGVVNAGRALEPRPEIAGLAVVKLSEAVAVREAGIRKPLLLLGPLAEADLEEALSRDITPMVYTPLGPALERVSIRLGRPVPIQVCVDTGIGRVGVPFREAPALVRDLAGRPGVTLAGIMMTYAEDREFDREQLGRFEALCASLAAERLQLGPRHAASSFTLFQGPEAWLDMVRPGMALYGCYPEQRFRTAPVMDMRPSAALRARVAYVKQLKKGESAGYERAYRAPHDVYLATLPVGHVDGLPRTAAKGGRVRIGDEFYPIVASVSASHTILEVGPEPRVAIGDEATFFDWRAGSRPEDFAAGFGGSVYDLMMHLGPLLPRRVLPSA